MAEVVKHAGANQLSSGVELEYARKSYRYLRVALVSMVVAILVAVGVEVIENGELLGSISAYYYTPVHSIFIGGLVMIGVCLVAIRGSRDPEDIALNLAGLCAPIVAFAPTDFPSKELTYKTLITDDLPVVDFALNNVIALGGAALFAIALTFGLRAYNRDPSASREINWVTVAGFVLAAAVVAALIAVYAIWGLKHTHGLAAVGLIGGLWFVATANGVRNLRDSNGRRGWAHHVNVGASGSIFLVGAALASAGLLRLIDGGSPIPCAAGVILVVAILVFRGSALHTYLRPPKDELESFDRIYLWTASVMAVGAPAIAALPAGFEHRTFWIELAELVPFGFFWVIQTIENWNPPAGRVEPSETIIHLEADVV